MHKLKSCLMGIIAFLFSFLSLVCISDRFNIKNRKIAITNKKIKKNTTFIFLSDLHAQYFGKNLKKDFSYIYERIDQINPDFIVVGGDVVLTKFANKIDVGIDFLSGLAKKYKVYFAAGNHEARLGWEKKSKVPCTYSEFKRQLTENGVIVLDNECIELKEAGIRIYGLNLPEKYYNKKYHAKLTKAKLFRLLKYKRNDLYDILIAHDPEYIDAYRKSECNLVLSGHMHGGMMRLPKGYGFISPRYGLFVKNCWGARKDGRIIHVITQGLAQHTIPVRLFNPAEIVTINLKKR